MCWQENDLHSTGEINEVFPPSNMWGLEEGHRESCS